MNSSMLRNSLNIPNTLTLGRIVLIFALVPCFYTGSETAKLTAFIIFCIACITDYLDGYLARSLKQTTKFGKLLDPVADKMLIATTLLMMAAFDYFSHLSLIPALIILCREILVSGLREFMGAKNQILEVSKIAKYKTTFQMISIGLILMSDIFSHQFKELGEFCLWIASILTIITGLQYFKKTLENM